MAWWYILMAAVFEITWAIGMKLSHGFSKPWPSAITVAAMILSFVFLLLAVRQLPIGTAYAIWTGLGAVGVALLGILILGEPAGVLRLFFIGVIVAGIVGLKLATPA